MPDFLNQIGAIEGRMKPRLTVPVKMIPEAKDWIVGDDYKIELSVTQKALRELEDDSLEVSFEINKMKAL